MKRLRCRAGVWERARWIHNYQCNNAAKGEMEMRGVGGATITLPACGIHLRQKHQSAYIWHGSQFEAQMQEYVER